MGDGVRRSTLAATALFVVGVTVERSNGHTESTPASTTSVPFDEGDTSEHSDEGSTGEHSDEGSTGEHTDERATTDEEILGVNPESTPVVVVAVLLALSGRRCLVAAEPARPSGRRAVRPRHRRIGRT